jgi:hypothetical protein
MKQTRPPAIVIAGTVNLACRNALDAGGFADHAGTLSGLA